MVVRRKRDALSMPQSEVEDSLRIQVNGEPRDVDDGTTLSELISTLQLKPEQIAVELNRMVVRRAEWPKTELCEGDTLEIVHFVGGGVNKTISAIADYTDYVPNIERA